MTPTDRDLGYTRMLITAFFFLAGVLLLFALGIDVAPWLAASLAGLAVVTGRYCPGRYLALGCFAAAAGLFWAWWNASGYLAHRLPERLAGVDMVVTGAVNGIPVLRGHVQRFQFDVEEVVLPDGVDARHVKPPRRIRLSWYDANAVRAGEHWQLTVRLKPPHGFMNPGGFDYEAWLYRQGVHATGYVRKGGRNTRLSVPGSMGIDQWRERIAAAISSHDTQRFTGLLQALAVGERSAISGPDWDVLIRTGTIHLMAISGLHIGLAAGFGFGLALLVCRRLLPARWMLYVPAQVTATCTAIVTAMIYAALAGFTVPTQRALIMLAVVSAAFLSRRQTRPFDVLAAALLFVLLLDPASVLAPGFWFSFLAVAAIFHATGRFKERSVWFRAAWIQLVLSVSLLPLSMWLFQQGSLISPLANFFLVPYVSFLVVPLVLLGMLFLPVSSLLSEAAFRLADQLFSLAWPVLEALSLLPYATWSLPDPGLPATFAAMAGVALLMTVRSLRWRLLAPLLLVPALASSAEPVPAGDYRIAVLDVGQGLAVVVQTRSHTLIYDTGARFGDRLDAGSAVIVPYLRHQGIDRIDRLVVSHGDNDHIGGARAVLKAYPGTPVTGQEIEGLVRDGRSCTRGESWNWDGVEFRFLHPAILPAGREQDGPEGNNLSCVLRVRGRGGTALLTGDIEASVERRLTAEQPAQLDADIMLVPHHGSMTSSSRALLQAVSPAIAIVPSGYRNRFRFPREEVIERYRALDTHIYNTATDGMIRIDVSARHGVGRVQRYRRDADRLWRHRPGAEKP